MNPALIDMTPEAEQIAEALSVATPEEREFIYGMLKWYDPVVNYSGNVSAIDYYRTVKNAIANAGIKMSHNAREREISYLLLQSTAEQIDRWKSINGGLSVIAQAPYESEVRHIGVFEIIDLMRKMDEQMKRDNEHILKQYDELSTYRRIAPTVPVAIENEEPWHIGLVDD